METSKRSVAEPAETAEYLAGMADEMAETGRRSGLHSRLPVLDGCDGGTRHRQASASPRSGGGARRPPKPSRPRPPLA